MASSFWLYLGIILVCSGIATPFGIILLVIYFWDELKKNLKFSQYNDNTYNIQNVNITDNDSSKSGGAPIDYMSNDTKEEFR